MPLDPFAPLPPDLRLRDLAASLLGAPGPVLLHVASRRGLLALRARPGARPHSLVLAALRPARAAGAARAATVDSPSGAV